MLAARFTIAVLVALLAAPLAAQDKGKKKKPAKADAAAAAPVAARPTDDAATKKDKAIAAIDQFLAAHSPSRGNDSWRTTMSQPPQQTFAAGSDYFWHLRTNKGELTIRLFADTAPMHVTNAIYLTRAGFYDGLAFHRVIKGFMAQGGCPLGNGNGGPGYVLDGEFGGDRKHDRKGLVSAANAAKPMTDGSQFFLTFVPTPHLDGIHTNYGEVIDGMPVLDALEAAGGDMETGKPQEPLRIELAWITVAPRAGEPADDHKGDGKGDGKGDDKAGGDKKDDGKKGGKKK